MRKTYTRTETANKALDYLHERYLAKIPTPKIVEGIGLRDTDANRTLLRDILSDLANANHVTKTEKGAAFLWQATDFLVSDGWDRSQPFKCSRPGYTPPPKTEEPEPTEEEEETPVPAQTTEIAAKMVEEINRLRGRITDLETAHSSVAKELRTELEAKEDRIDKLEQMAAEASRQVRVLVIKQYDGKTIKLKDKVLPKVFPKVLDLVRCRRNVLLVGPAGCGKSYLAKLAAESLGLRFGKVGGSGGLQEHHLLGWSRPNFKTGKDTFITTDFLRCFEQGGLCLVDEIDAADQNVLLALNPALDQSGDLPIPNRGDAAKKHKNFICVATANTFGRGADRVYAGRNPLDEATIDRFRIGVVECDYDEAVDRALCPNDEIRQWCQSIRERINLCKMRRVMSSRFIEDAFVMHREAGWTLETVKETFFEGWSRDEISKVTAA